MIITDLLRAKVISLRYPKFQKTMCDKYIDGGWTCSREAGHQGPHVGYAYHRSIEQLILEDTWTDS